MGGVLAFIQDVLAMLATPEGQKVVADLEAVAGIAPVPAAVAAAALGAVVGQPATGPVLTQPQNYGRADKSVLTK